MKIKKLLALTGVFVTLCVTLTGCATKETEVKTIEKTADVDVIKYIGNEEERNMINATEESFVNNPDELEENRGYTVKYASISNENGYYLKVYGYDANDKKIWEYVTDIDSEGAQYAKVELLKHDVKHGRIIIRENDKIKTINDQTGIEIWSVSGFEGYCSYTDVDDSGNIYVYTIFQPRIYVISNEGKMKYNIEVNLEPESEEVTEFITEYAWPWKKDMNMKTDENGNINITMITELQSKEDEKFREIIREIVVDTKTKETKSRIVSIKEIDED